MILSELSKFPVSAAKGNRQLSRTELRSKRALQMSV